MFVFTNLCWLDLFTYTFWYIQLMRCGNFLWPVDKNWQDNRLNLSVDIVYYLRRTPTPSCDTTDSIKINTLREKFGIIHFVLWTPLVKISNFTFIKVNHDVLCLVTLDVRMWPSSRLDKGSYGRKTKRSFGHINNCHESSFILTTTLTRSDGTKKEQLHRCDLWGAGVKPHRKDVLTLL